MTTAVNLTALRAAALAGDRVAMLALADIALERGEDDRADAWRWLADPPAEGWERRVPSFLPWGPVRLRRGVCVERGGSGRVLVSLYGGAGWYWHPADGWRGEVRHRRHGCRSLCGTTPPPGVREACL